MAATVLAGCTQGEKLTPIQFSENGSVTSPEANTKWEDLTEALSCFDTEFDSFAFDTFIINDAERYAALSKRPITTCKEKSLPEIDFTKRTLLGQRMRIMQGCSFDVEKTVERSDEGKSIKFYLDVSTTGPCAFATTKMYWVSIPKKPSDFEVFFEAEYQHDGERTDLVFNGLSKKCSTDNDCMQRCSPSGCFNKVNQGNQWGADCAFLRYQGCSCVGSICEPVE